MKKKFISLFITAVMLLAVVVGIVACNSGTQKITVWVSEVDGVKTLTEGQIKDFLEANPQYQGKYEIKVEGASEMNSASQMIANVADGADIFCFAQDQFSRLYQAGALSQITGKAEADIRANNDADAVAAASQGDKIYCFPITSDNGYFMYYDKSVVSEDHIGSLEDIIADVVKANKLIAMPTNNDGFYAASFFLATGCKSEWTRSEDGSKFVAIDDTFNSPEGIIALKGMNKLTSLSDRNYKSSSNASEFSNGAAVVVSGVWSANNVEFILKQNYGVAKLPSFTVDGNTYQMGSYSGRKMMGIKPHNDAQVQSFCQNLAAYLSGEACQLDRYNAFKWGPSNLKVQQNPDVLADPALKALAAQNQFATPQGQVAEGWFAIVNQLGDASKKNTVEEYQAALNKYDADCNDLLN